MEKIYKTCYSTWGKKKIRRHLFAGEIRSFSSFLLPRKCFHWERTVSSASFLLFLFSSPRSISSNKNCTRLTIHNWHLPRVQEIKNFRINFTMNNRIETRITNAFMNGIMRRRRRFLSDFQLDLSTTLECLTGLIRFNLRIAVCCCVIQFVGKVSRVPYHSTVTKHSFSRSKSINVLSNLLLKHLLHSLTVDILFVPVDNTRLAEYPACPPSTLCKTYSYIHYLCCFIYTYKIMSSGVKSYKLLTVEISLYKTYCKSSVNRFACKWFTSIFSILFLFCKLLLWVLNAGIDFT